MKAMSLLFVAFLSLFLSGCTSSIYYNAELDPSHSINQRANFRVFLPKNPTIEDKKIKVMLEEALIRHGYMNNPNIQAQYGIFFQTLEKTYTSTQNTTDKVPTTSYSTTYVKGVPVVTTTQEEQVVARTYTVSNTYKKIKVYLVVKNDEKLEEVWTGFTSPELDTYKENPAAVIDQLVQLMGKDFEDDIFVEMDPNENPK